MKVHRNLGLVVAVVFLAAVAAQAQGTVPAGTAIVVTLNEGVDSKTARVGQKVEGSVRDDVVAGGRTVIPRGSRVVMSVARAESAGRLKGQARLWLKIDSVEVRGRSYTVASRWSGQTGPNANKRNVVAIGGGAGAGAIIGAIAGGGKGAAIGAAVGAAAGTVGAAATRDRDIEFPPETQLRFTLRQALRIN